MKKAGLIQKWPINVLSLLDMTNVPATWLAHVSLAWNKSKQAVQLLWNGMLSYQQSREIATVQRSSCSRDIGILDSPKDSHKFDSLVPRNFLSLFCTLIKFFHYRVLSLIKTEIKNVRSHQGTKDVKKRYFNRLRLNKFSLLLSMHKLGEFDLTSGRFITSDHFFYSRDLYVWSNSDIVRRT